MAKQKSAIISIAGFVAGFVTDFVNAVHEQGGTDDDLYRLVTPGGRPLIRQMAKLVVDNRFTVLTSSVFQLDKRKDRWLLLEDCGPESILPPTGFRIVPIMYPPQYYITGEELIRRAVSIEANYGQRQAEDFIAHQVEIPMEYRTFYMVFSGTQWLDRDGRRRVPCLEWDGWCWCLDFRSLDDYFNQLGCFVLPSEKLLESEDLYFL